jgi:hypothetical protein
MRAAALQGQIDRLCLRFAPEHHQAAVQPPSIV